MKKIVGAVLKLAAKVWICKKSLLSECAPDQLNTFFHFLVPVVLQVPKSDKKKHSTGQGYIGKEETSTELHILDKGPFLYYVRVVWGFIEPPTHLRKDIFTT